MKNQIINLINYIETKREANPKLFKVLWYILWCAAPIEMSCIKLGVFGYKKIKSYDNKEVLQ